MVKDEDDVAGDAVVEGEDPGPLDELGTFERICRAKLRTRDGL